MIFHVRKVCLKLVIIVILILQNPAMRKLLTQFSLLFFLGIPCFNQEVVDTVENSLITDRDIFSINEPAELTLRFNMKEFRKNQKEERYVDADLTYRLGDSMPDCHYSVRIKARGNRRQDLCSFPPIWINISGPETKDPGLGDVGKVKLVTHCVNGGSYENYILKEYLAYKIYNLLSPYSFRVRLVRMNYIDTGKKDRLTSRFGFLIEPESMMAERLDKIPLKNPNLSIKMTDSLWTMRMSIFQYLIGNADYSVRNRHNIKLLAGTEFPPPGIIPVPYDFDYCGMVNAHYAVPADNLGIRNVTERYFLGPCRPSEEYMEIMEWISGFREEIFALVNGFHPLPETEKQFIIGYFEDFFNNAGDIRYLERSILSSCL